MITAIFNNKQNNSSIYLNKKKAISKFSDISLNSNNSNDTFSKSNANSPSKISFSGKPPSIHRLRAELEELGGKVIESDSISTLEKKIAELTEDFSDSNRGESPEDIVDWFNHNT